MTRLIPVEKESVNLKGYRRALSKNEALFEEFIAMDIPAVRVEWTDEWKNLRSAYKSLWSATKKFSDLPVRVIKNGNELYLVRRDMYI